MTFESTILALDLGTTTGWAFGAPGQPIVSGTQSFKPHRFEGGGMRYLRFRRWLTELKATTEGLQAIYFEEVRRHAGVDAAHVYGGFLATLTAWCEHHQIPYSGVPIGTIKRHATGKGNAGKAAVIEAMRALGHAPQDDNEADALAILHWAKSLPADAAVARDEGGSKVEASDPRPAMRGIDPKELARLWPFMSEADKAEFDALLTDVPPMRDLFPGSPKCR
jgi:Holliday junction resolvasome RuvABC endonuclease subunit